MKRLEYNFKELDYKLVPYVVPVFGSGSMPASINAAPMESPHTFIVVRHLSKNQSIINIMEIPSIGKPTAYKTMTIVTRPASGIPAAPIAAKVAVKNIINKCPMLKSIPYN